MHILGLTGSIAMGKSTVATMLRRFGIPVYDSDAAVHTLLSSAAMPTIAATFPDAIQDGVVDRLALGSRVFGDPVQLRQLEAILHPLVRQAEKRFLQRAATRHTTLVALEIPLLFETCSEQRCDTVVVVTAPQFLQTQRALCRVGMTLHKLEAIRLRQTPEIEKRRRAHFVVPTGLGLRATVRCLMRVIGIARMCPSHHWPPRPLSGMSRQGRHYA
ncbi:Dephospho-CoA kinase [invertebrate metagenome]|uniref:Dephospho-CoA kinase n=1 Tax=invertebrate metagenome TaxID=1711999 RepID=A0A484H7L7_9ZZZZ